jgi:hypothetical protein
LPGQEFICRQHVAAAGFLGRQEPAADPRNDFRLATNDPALRTGMREICYRQGATVRPLDVPRWTMVSGHGIFLWAARGARSILGTKPVPGLGDRLVARVLLVVRIP